MDTELLFEKVGACRLSKSGEGLNIHIQETNEYLTIPLTDVKAIVFEQMVNGNRCPMPTIGTVRKYHVKPKEQIKKSKKGED
jgi:hypothetical protein